MSKPRWQELDGQVGDLIKRLEGLDHRQEEIETAFRMSDPSSVVAAEAYEGLRRQVIDATSERMAHLAQLVQFSHVLANTSSIEQLRKHVEGWREEAGLEVVSDPAHPDADRLFDLLGGEGEALELIEPAYVDARSGRVVRQGRMRRIEAAVTPAVEPGTGDPGALDVAAVEEQSEDEPREDSA